MFTQLLLCIDMQELLDVEGLLNQNEDNSVSQIQNWNSIVSPCRSIELYDKLDTIGEGTYGVVCK